MGAFASVWMTVKVILELRRTWKSEQFAPSTLGVLVHPSVPPWSVSRRDEMVRWTTYKVLQTLCFLFPMTFCREGQSWCKVVNLTPHGRAGLVQSKHENFPQTPKQIVRVCFMVGRCCMGIKEHPTQNPPNSNEIT